MKDGERMTKRKINRLLIKRAGLRAKLRSLVNTVATLDMVPGDYIHKTTTMEQKIAKISKKLELGGYKEEKGENN